MGLEISADDSFTASVAAECDVNGLMGPVGSKNIAPCFNDGLVCSG
jgi:hypothetical protein